MTTGVNTKLTAQIGEHLVSAVLGAFGYYASPYSGNVPRFDVTAVHHCCPTNFQNSTRACCGLGGLGLGGPELNSSIMGLRSNRLSLSSRNICCMLRLERLMNFR